MYNFKYDKHSSKEGALSSSNLTTLDDNLLEATAGGSGHGFLVPGTVHAPPVGRVEGRREVAEQGDHDDPHLYVLPVDHLGEGADAECQHVKPKGDEAGQPKFGAGPEAGREAGTQRLGFDDGIDEQGQGHDGHVVRPKQQKIVREGPVQVASQLVVDG